MSQKNRCEMCSTENAISLQEWSKKDELIFGRIPIKHLVNLWNKQGFPMDTMVCKECIIK